MDQGRCALKIVAVLALTLTYVLITEQASIASPPEGWYPLSPGSDDPAPPAIVLVTEELSESVVMIDIPGLFLETITEEGTDYSRVTIPGYGEQSEIGFPELPVVPVVLAVPESDSLHVSVTVLDSVELTDILPLPAPDWVVEYTLEGHPYLQSVFAPNGAFYGRTESGPFYPGAPIDGAGRGHLREQAFSRVELRPFQYEPGTGVLKVFTRLRIVVEHTQSRGARTCDIGPFTGMAASMLLGYDRLPEAGGSRGGRDGPGTVTWAADYDACIGSAPDYLIIYDNVICPVLADSTTHEGKRWLGRLANKRAWYDGFNVALLPATQLTGTGDRDEKIRETVDALYDSESAAHMADGHLGFVLLVGDADSEQTDDGIPMHDIPHFFGVADSTLGDHVSTDHWYVCVADTDRVADVSIGRLAPGTVDELVTDARKTITYEPVDPSESWRQRVFLSCGFDSHEILNQSHANAHAQIDSLEAFFARQNDNYHVTAKHCHLFPGDPEEQRDAMSIANVDSFNLGRFVTVFYDHGYEIGNWTFDWGDTDSLQNTGMPSLVLSQACSSGAVDNTTVPDGQGNYDSLGERLMHIDASGETGAVAFLGATEPAYDKDLARLVIGALFDEWRPMLGTAVDAGKAALFAREPWDKYALAVHEFTLVGDPALDLLLAENDGYATLPDLLTRSGDMEVPRSVSYRDEIVLRCEIANESAVDIPTGTAVEAVFEIRDADGQLHQAILDTVDGLEAWGLWIAEATWNAGTEDLGDYEVTVMADPDSIITELREENNINDSALPLSINFNKQEFPKSLGDVSALSQLAITEVHDPDNGDDIILCYRISGSGGIGTQIVEVRDMDGTESWSFARPGIPGSTLAPAVADMDGDGQQEIVVLLSGVNAMMDTCFLLAGSVAQDRVRAKFHVGTGRGVPLLADINPLDGRPEILLAADAGSGEYVSAWDTSGAQPDTSWAYYRDDFGGTGDRPLTLVNFAGAPGDVVTWMPGQDPAELVCMGADGQQEWSDEITGDPIARPGYGSAAADLNGDGSLDIASALSFVPQLLVHNAETGNVIGSSAAGGVGSDADVVIGDVDGDGELDVVVAGFNRIDVFNASTDAFGVPEWSKTLPAHMALSAQPLIGDIDGGSDSEIVVATAGGTTSDNRLWILKPSAGEDTLELVTPSIWLPGKYATGAICDLDANGYAEIVFTTDDGSLHDLEYWEPSTGRFDWPMYRHDPQRTGVHSCPVSGTLAESASWVGDMEVSGDVTVQSSNVLYLQPRTDVGFAPDSDDSVGGGANPGLCEIIVHGRMESFGGSGSAATTVRSDSSPGSWYGLVFKSGSACLLNHVSIQDAYKTVWATSADPVVLDGCVLEPQSQFGVQLTDCTGEARIESCTIAECRVGIQCSGTQAEIIGNEITEVHEYGIKLASDHGSSITRNDVSLRVQAGLGQYTAGLRVTSVVPPAVVSVTDDTISVDHQNSIGIWASVNPGPSMNIARNVLSGRGSAMAVKLANASATLRENELSGFSTAYYLMAKNLHTIELGDDVGSPGLNCTAADFTCNIQAFGTGLSPPIYAQNNWWGTASPDSGKFQASNITLLWQPYLTEDPRGRGGRAADLQEPRRVFLSQASPNPFNPTTTIAFGLPEAGEATVAIYDVRGRCVRELLASVLDAGEHRVVWDGTDDAGYPVASGVYFCRLQTETAIRQAKLVLLK